MHSNRINELLDKYLNNTITTIEADELSDLYKQIGEQQSDYPDEREVVKERILAGLTIKVQAKKKPVKLWPWLSAAAMLLIIGYFSYQAAQSPSTLPRAAQQIKKGITPGGNYAFLTLSNGEVMNLESLDTGKIAVQGGMDIYKLSNQKIAYRNNGNSLHSHSEQNAITTPMGGQFQIRLPDGTDVWLNAKTTLTYESNRFVRNRTLSLVGEAYFEVFKNKQSPFKVLTGKNEVEVLGTHFNISAYEKESAKTTLLEGSVLLTYAKQKALLQPGQQGIANKPADPLLVHDVNVEDAVSWKNGYFSFRGDNLPEAMNKISRWYDVDVTYNGNPENLKLGGSVSRTENIRKLLDYMELTGVATFKIQERRIIVNCK